MTQEQLIYYETLHNLVTRMRNHHWDAKKYRSRSSAEKEHRLGLEIDKLVRKENLKRNKTNHGNREIFNEKAD